MPKEFLDIVSYLDGDDVIPDTSEAAAKKLAKKLDKFLHYLEYIEKIPERKRTAKENELIEKYGTSKVK